MESLSLETTGEQKVKRDDVAELAPLFASVGDQMSCEIRPEHNKEYPS
jgi:hypothetical protein